MSTYEFDCADCGEHIVHTDSFITGYGIVREGGTEKKVCYACCAKRDIADMRDCGRITLYLTLSQGDGSEPRLSFVSNWPGTLKFNVYHRKTGRHNIAGKREDVWFTGPDGSDWWGVCYGYNTQLCHCKRLRAA